MTQEDFDEEEDLKSFSIYANVTFTVAAKDAEAAREKAYDYFRSQEAISEMDFDIEVEED